MKHIKHDGNVTLDQVIDIARTMRERSMARTLSGTVKEMLGTCNSVGCTVNGQSPRDIQVGQSDNGQCFLAFSVNVGLEIEVKRLICARYADMTRFLLHTLTLPFFHPFPRFVLPLCHFPLSSLRALLLRPLRCLRKTWDNMDAAVGRNR